MDRKRGFDYGENIVPLRVEYFGMDHEGLTWSEQVLSDFHPPGAVDEDERQKREIRLLRHDGTAVHTKDFESLKADWHVELAQRVRGVIGFTLRKVDYPDRVKVTTKVDKVIEEISHYPPSEANLEVLLSGYGLIEKRKDEQGNTWIIEWDSDQLVKRLKRKTPKGASVIFIKTPNVIQVSHDEEIFVDLDGKFFDELSHAFNDPEQIIHKLNKIFPPSLY